MSLSKRFPYFSVRRTALALLGSAILSFGLYNIHAFSGVTEGGVLGLTLLLHHWFGISPSVSGLILNALCYVAGWKTLGQSFIFYSIIAGGGFSAFYAIFEQFNPLWPSLAQMPLVAAIIGALFVGIGVGLSVRAGGAPGTRCWRSRSWRRGSAPLRPPSGRRARRRIQTGRCSAP